MGFDLGGIFAAVTDPGSLVNNLAHQLLPKDLQFLGGIAGAVVDYECGNPVGALKEGLSSFKDLSQNNLSSGRPTGPGGVPSTPWLAQPTPPLLLAMPSPDPTKTPLAGPSSTAPSGARRVAPVSVPPAGAPPAAPPDAPLATLLRPVISPHLVFATPHPTSTPGLNLAQSLGAPVPTSSAWRGTPPSTPPSANAMSQSLSTPAPASAAWRGTPPSTPPSANAMSQSLSTPAPTSAAWRGTPPSKTDPSTPPTDTSPPSVATTPTAPATPGASSAASTSSSSSSQNQPVTDAAKAFLNQGNDPLMSAIRAGNIPAAVSDSPAAMMALQAKMNHISEMNQLMTSMMTALHQMQMSIIQNVRV